MPSIYGKTIPQLVEQGWTVAPKRKVGLVIRSAIPDWNELTWAQQTYYRAKYRFDQEGKLEIRLSEVSNESYQNVFRSTGDLYPSKYVTPGCSLPGSDERLREILEQSRVDLDCRSRDKTALVHFGPDGSVIYTNCRGWGPPLGWPEDKHFLELDESHLCYWESDLYWIGESPCWTCPECNGF